MLLGLLAAVPASDLAIALVNRAVMGSAWTANASREWNCATAFPRRFANDRRRAHAADYSKGNPKNRSSGWKSITWRTPDGDLRFALLSDWLDAPYETLPGDDDLLAVAMDGIARLNKRYGPAPDGGERFFLFHRKRVWNECEGKWMGWERKTGKAA